MCLVAEADRDPVVIYKSYAEKRPSEMNLENAPFYLAVENNVLLNLGSRSQL